MENIRLTQLSRTAGWAAKLSPGALSQVLRGLPELQDANLLVGFDKSDDACVYKLSDTEALVQTVDFFPPVVDDPYLFGQIAAANALSDVYAMGGAPFLAMNLLCVPACLPPETAGQIMAGGLSKVTEAGAIIAGGHTISDDEPKYGLCVTGKVHPEQIWRNGGAIAGDVLVLTKPLGTGILNTALKCGMITEEQHGQAAQTMAQLNKYAADAAKGFTVHACTDVTGFGLMGHASEMAAASEASLQIFADKLPLLQNTLRLAGDGATTGGGARNAEYLKDKLEISVKIKEEMCAILHDPQTSGGLLFAIPHEESENFLNALLPFCPLACVIGTAVEKTKTLVYIV